MAKKVPITKVLSCFFVIVFLMSSFSVAVIASDSSNSTVSNVTDNANSSVESVALSNNITDLTCRDDLIYINKTETVVNESGNSDLPVLNDTDISTAKTVSSLGYCSYVWIEITDKYCKGYEVYVDGVYQFTEGEDSVPDGYCRFKVTPGYHTFKLTLNGKEVSKGWNCQCGTGYNWMSMNDMIPHWCEGGGNDNPTDEYEVKFRGTVTSTTPSEYDCGFKDVYICEVKIEKVVSGDYFEKGDIVNIVYSQWRENAHVCGTYDKVSVGDTVEVYGEMIPMFCVGTWITICGKNSYYLKKISSESHSINVWTDKSEYKIGETVKIYYQTNKKCTAKLTITKPDGGKVVYGPNEIPACTRSKSATAGYPTGKRTVVFEAWAGSEYKKATCYFEVVEEKKPKQPSPEITKVEYPTACVKEDGYATISVTVKNNGGASSEGYISVSFPNDEQIFDVSGTGCTYNKLYPKGSWIWNNKDQQMESVDPLVELLDTNWGKGQQETITMNVKPNSGSDEIVFYVRAALKNDADGSYERDPTYSGYTDQQGWYVEKHSVDVCEVEEVKFRGEILADHPIISFYSFDVKIDTVLDDPTGNLQKGETVNVYGHRSGPAQVDDVTVGDTVEVFGEYRGYVGTYEQIFLSDWDESSSDHYVKKIAEKPAPEITATIYPQGGSNYKININFKNNGEESAQNPESGNGVHVQIAGADINSIDKGLFDEYLTDFTSYPSVYPTGYKVVEFYKNHIDTDEECTASLLITTSQENLATLKYRGWITDKDDTVFNPNTNQNELYIARAPTEDINNPNNPPYNQHVIFESFSFLDYELYYLPVYRINLYNTNNDATWIGLGWTYYHEENSIRSLLDKLHAHSIHEIYLNIGGADQNGDYLHPELTKEQVKENCTHFMNVVQNYIIENQYEFQVLAWVNGDIDSYDIKIAIVRENIGQLCSEFASEDVGFDGIHFDFEFWRRGADLGYDDGYVHLIKEIKNGIPDNKILSIDIIPTWLPNDNPEENYVDLNYVKSIAEKVDEIVLMAYDSGRQYESYREWVKDRTIKMFEQSSNTNAEVVIGVPTSDTVTEWHKKGENLVYALTGTMQGANSASQPKVRISIYANWETSEYDWNAFETIWHPS